MLNWLHADDCLATIRRETAASIEVARLSNLVPVGPSRLEWLGGLIRERTHVHSMTDYPCRLPDGRMGRTSIRQVQGEWVALCVR